MAIFEPDPTDKRMIRYRGMPVGLPDAEKLLDRLEATTADPTDYFHKEAAQMAVELDAAIEGTYAS